MANVRLLSAIDKEITAFLEAHPLALDPDRHGYLFLSEEDEQELREYGEVELIEAFENGWTYRGLQVYYSPTLRPGQIVISRDRGAMRELRAAQAALEAERGRAH